MQCNFDVFDITPSVQSHRRKTQVKVGKTRSYLHTDCATVSFRYFCIQNYISNHSNCSVWRAPLNWSIMHRTHQCQQCEFETTQKGNLQRHIKSVHDGQKFPCPQCEYKATQKGDLKKHNKSVHAGRKFPCPKCEYKATQKRSLQTHLKSVHTPQM